jgi:hypothetical protein
LMSSQCEILIKELKRHLQDVVKERGEHVHQRRSDDTGLRILGLVEHMVEMGRRPRSDRQGFFEEARKEKCFWMRANNVWLTGWLNSTSVALAPMLILRDGTFGFPFIPGPKGVAAGPRISHKS